MNRLVNYVKALRRSEVSGAGWQWAAAEGATDSELVALKYRSAERQLQASKTAAYVAMYSGW